MPTAIDRQNDFCDPRSAEFRCGINLSLLLVGELLLVRARIEAGAIRDSD